MKLDFVGMSEHILRTPITLLRGHLHNLFNDKTISKLNEEEIKSLNKAVKSIDELKDHVENLLNLSEISQGRLTLDLVETSLEELVNKVIDEYKQQAEKKGIQLIYIPSLYEIPTLKMDIMKMIEVIRNLISNAVKFTDHGRVEVSVSKTKDKKQEFVQVMVKDTGKGIPEKNIPHIFSKFYRIKRPLEMESSSGLGLFVTKRIIDAHGGNIWVESTEGHGSTFYFTLPIPSSEE
jgi:signal transduction histidine kinase